ncbi:MAG: hypothetical protein MJY54_03355 [archaeon]|nr:hypothetical protein [archaeon]
MNVLFKISLLFCALLSPSIIRSQTSCVRDSSKNLKDHPWAETFDSIVIEFHRPGITNTYKGVDLAIRQDNCIAITRKGERHRAIGNSKGWMDTTYFVNEIHNPALYDEFLGLIVQLFISRTVSIYEKIEERLDGDGVSGDMIFPIVLFSHGRPVWKYMVTIYDKDDYSCYCYYSDEFKRFLIIFESLIGIEGCISDNLL